MKKTGLLLIIMLITILFVNAQDVYNDVLLLVKKNKLDDAKEIVDKLVENDKENPKNWMYRGAVYQAIHESTFPEFQKLHDNPLQESYQSFNKSIALDDLKEYLQTNLKYLGILSNLFVKKAVDLFNEGKYNKALLNFENSMAINDMPAIMFLDTMVIYNAAITAEKINQNEKSISYYKKLIVFGFEKARMYKELAQVYKKINNYKDYYNTLKEGVKVCDNEVNLVIELVNYTLSQGNTEEAIKYIEIALGKNKNNAGLYYVRASLFDQVKESEKAIEYYEMALKYDPEYIDALFNIGAIYYNEGVELIKIANTKAEKTDADNKYKKALPYFEKVHQINPNDKDTIELLKILYKITKQDDKLKELENK